MTVPEPLVPAVLGAAAMATAVVALWTPGWRRRHVLGQLVSRLVDERGLARDLGGGRRRSSRLAPVPTRTGPIDRIARTLASLSPWERRRRSRFREQLADSLSLLASSVRAGHTLVQAFEQLAREAPAPTGAAFAAVVREIGLGAAHDDALHRLARRFPSEEVDLFVTAVNVQDQVGGSLAKVLDSIAYTLRERARIEGDIRALTAQQRYSAYVLALLPVAVAAMLTLVGPDYMAPLYEPGALRIVLVLAGLLILVGFLIMRRIAAIDV
ncbi:MAG: type II secretion system F family protein [Chloroflexota bacterium]|nr:type II secretion system F family protein [Chloroflexota bacterium]MDE3101128.1 type II secretion system F family protein [Chloroflexota bacterium]